MPVNIMSDLLPFKEVRGWKGIGLYTTRYKSKFEIFVLQFKTYPWKKQRPHENVAAPILTTLLLFDPTDEGTYTVC
jgi:hypothetical protein